MNERHPIRIRDGILIFVRRAEAMDQERTIDIWCRAVDSSHHFLTPTDGKEIEKEVRDFLPHVPLWLAVDESDRPLGFMLLEGNHLAALFVDPSHHGRGIGRTLLQHALTFHRTITADVNEDNTRAREFYKRIGFERTGRSPVDDQGRPYPLIHMRMCSEENE